MTPYKPVATGKVQGVFFRAAVKEHADSLGIFGYVHNRDDGSVEICMQGEKEALDLFLQHVIEKPGAGHVEHLTPPQTCEEGPFTTFEIHP
ncbi:MAG: acylphosphatase [Simkaniaceae bacterium]|nr:acylphosphatase [Simkaniaceae bacterium]